MRLPCRNAAAVAWRTRLAVCVSLLALTGAAAQEPTSATAPRTLRVCADPNQLPFSNLRGEGFENKIVALIGDELQARIEFEWRAQRRGFVRETVKAGLCDLIAGVPSGYEPLSTTRPYYRSSYVFVSRRDRGLDIASFDEPRLSRLRIGVQLVGDDGANTPPAHALANRGMITNVVGYMVYGDYAQESPSANILRAVVGGDIDVAVVWGPLAGYFAMGAPVPLNLRPVSPQVDLPFLPFVFDIAMGVRRGEDALRRELDAALIRRRPQIDAILAAYGVPRLDRGAGAPR